VVAIPPGAAAEANMAQAKAHDRPRFRQPRRAGVDAAREADRKDRRRCMAHPLKRIFRPENQTPFDPMRATDPNIRRSVSSWTSQRRDDADGDAVPKAPGSRKAVRRALSVIRVNPALGFAHDLPFAQSAHDELSTR